jgi:hypothetical protein
MAVRLLLVRPLAGTVGERERVAHVVPVPRGAGRTARLKACCGAEFGPGDVELLGKVSGMPCEACLWQAPRPELAELPVPDGDVLARLAAAEAAVRQLGWEVQELSSQLWRILRSHGDQQR